MITEKFSKLAKLFIAPILSLLGFQSCNIIDIDTILDKEQALEYGCPHVEYTIKGTVTDEQGNPVEGIRVAIHRNYDPSALASYNNPVFAKDTVYTDKNGQAGYTRDGMVAGIATVYLEDVKDGLFGSEVIRDIKAEQTRSGDGKWDKGAYEATFSATLKKK